MDEEDPHKIARYVLHSDGSMTNYTQQQLEKLPNENDICTLSRQIDRFNTYRRRAFLERKQKFYINNQWIYIIDEKHYNEIVKQYETIGGLLLELHEDPLSAEEIKEMDEFYEGE